MPSRERTERLMEPGAEEVFAGGGEMGALMRALNWADTPLGPVEDWPQSLKTSVSICLASRFPVLVWWGPELVMLYNDAYRPILGATKHPRAMGAPGRAIWPEIWNIIGPMLAGVIERGEATWSQDQMLPLHRKGYTEECYFTFSYSPIRDESGGVGGIFCAVTETTERVLGERRLATLRELAASTAEARTAEEACAAAAGVLAGNAADLPFALIYLLDADGRRAHLAGAAGMAPGGSASPAVVDLTVGRDAPNAWPLAHAMHDGPADLRDMAERFGDLPGGPWPEPPNTAMVLPIAQAGQERPAGLLVAGVSPRRALDDEYRGFLDLVAGQLATAVADARAYEAERQRAEALAELDRAKTAFFSNVSHEFRTPLTLLLGPLEDALADGDGALLPEQREHLEVAHRNSLRLLRLVNTLLDFSRIEAGRVQASYEPTDLPALTADLASIFRSAVERSGVRLVADCPPLSDGVEVYVDREMWEKIVLNLLSNALKFTFDGEIGVSLRATANGRSVELAVRDTGVGIPAEELPRLFERFHRVQGARARTHEGTGIGLALVHELVKLHGGSIAVMSEVGRGTTFTVTIPTGTAHFSADRLGVARTLASTAVGSAAFVEEALRWLPDDGGDRHEPRGEDDVLASLGLPEAPPPVVQRESGVAARVLLADDNADMRAYMTRLLAPQYVVEAVPDGEAALAAARECPPDLVLSDVMMPGMDGFALLRALREDPRTREVPVVLLSARAGEEATVEGIEAGADDYLVKPFAARELLARVGTHLELARVRAAAANRERAARAQAEALAAESERLYHEAQEQTQLHVQFNTALRELADARDRALTLLAAQKAALELAVSGASIDAVLNQIVRAAQEQSGEGARVALSIVDADGAHLRFGATAGMSEAYTRAVDGFAISPNNPSCGIAAYTGHTVIVKDVATDPLWAPYLALAREHGIRACWSFPIRSFGGKVLGTLAVYHGSPCEPEPRDLESVGLLAQTATLVIEQHNTAEERRKAEEELRRSETQRDGELSDTKLLQGISAQLISEQNVEGLYEKILDAAVAIMRAEYGSMQMLYPERGSGGELRLLAFRGFNLQAAMFWEWVRADSESTCGAALRTGERVIVPDVEKCEFMAGTDDQATYLQTGIHAVQTTPLISRGGEMLGMISTHWREPHQPSERDLRLLDILARQAADLLERKQAEDALSSRTAQYETLLNQAPLGVYLVDADFRIREVNPVALPVFGDIPGGVLGRDFDEIIHILWATEYADEVVRIFRQTLETGEPYVTPERAELRIDRGITEYYEWRLDRITLPDGRYGVVCYFRDISHQVQARLRIAESEERFRAIVGQATAGVSQTDFAGRFTLVNPRYCEIVGYAEAELLQMRMQDLTHPEDLPRNLEQFMALAEGGPDFTIEKRYIRKDGAVVWVNNSVTAVRDGGGKLQSVVAVTLDITERKRAEEERAYLFEAEQAARGRAEAAARARDEFLSIASHELRTPVATIKGYAQLLAKHLGRGAPEPERLAHHAPAISATTDRLGRLIDDLLDVSRLRTGQLTLRVHPIDLAALLREVVARTSELPEAAGHGIRVETAWEVCVVDVDPDRVEQIVVNLLDNAVKYSPEGGEVRAELRHQRKGAGDGDRQGVLLRVCDRGIGLPPDQLEAIFQPFGRASNAAERNIPGMGLGLYVCRQIAEAHGGRLWADSPGEGQGSIFSLWLPATSGRHSSTGEPA